MDEKERLERLVELNVQEQCLNLDKIAVIQKAKRLNKGLPRVHGMVYSLEDGVLKELEVHHDEETHKFMSIYALYAH